jgi:hypothetical protein
MTLVTDTWRQLVQRRLWPLALLLVAALVAVPMLLVKNPAPVAPAPLPSGTGAAAPAEDAANGTPVVALSTASDAHRHVLGARKDVFRPALVATPTPAPTAATTTTTSTTKTTGGTSSPATSGTGTTVPSVPVVPGSVPGTPAPKKKTFPADSLTIRFGTGDNDPKSVLRKGEGLSPDSSGAAAPLLVYLGPAKGGKDALFLVDAGVQADGDGHCDSSAANTCGTLRLHAGDTEFLSVTDDTGKVTAVYELDLVAIHAKQSQPAKVARHGVVAKARAALAGVASAGRASMGAGLAALLGSL